jgi:integrase
MPTFKASVKRVAELLNKRRTERTDYFDSAHPGLCLRIGPRGATWYLFRRVDGKLIRLALGTDDELAEAGRQANPEKPKASFTIARERAGGVESQLALGIHPRAEQARERAAKTEAIRTDEQRIVRNVIRSWKEQLADAEIAKSTRKDYERMIDAFAAEFGDHDIETIKRSHIKQYLATVKRRSPSVANRSLVVIRMLFTHAVDMLDLNSNPARDIAKPSVIRERCRTLSRDEVRVLWKACELAGYPYGTALQFALCTAQRIGEVGALLRRDVDRDGYWVQKKNKSDRRIDIHLASHARDLLDACPNFGRDKHHFSLSGGDNGLRSDIWPKAIARHIAPKIAEAAKQLRLEPIIAAWTPHDLRRTARTGMTGWTDIAPDTAERVLNHAITGLRKTYDHADYRPHVKEALRLWDEELSRVLAGKPSKRDQDGEQKTRAKSRKTSKKRA